MEEYRRLMINEIIEADQIFQEMKVENIERFFEKRKVVFSEENKKRVMKVLIDFYAINNGVAFMLADYLFAYKRLQEKKKLKTK